LQLCTINDKAEFQLPVVNFLGSSDTLPKINDIGNKKSCKFEIDLKKKLNTKSEPYENLTQEKSCCKNFGWTVL
jgi:hypothetical protein